jgi:1-acyl-sn-glycerol-3-phosphate acyltransferase
LFDFFEILTDRYRSHAQASEHLYEGWSLDQRDPEVIKAWMPVWEWLYHSYFRVQTEGWHHIPPEGKMLIVGSHNGGSASPDTSMFMYDWYRRFGYERLTYGLMHRLAWKIPNVGRLAAPVGAVIAHPKTAIAALQRDAAVLVYPGGAEDMFRPHRLRDRIYFAGRKGFIKLALREEAPIVPAISHGAHDTLIIWEIFINRHYNYINGVCRYGLIQIWVCFPFIWAYLGVSELALCRIFLCLYRFTPVFVRPLCLSGMGEKRRAIAIMWMRAMRKSVLRCNENLTI